LCVNRHEGDGEEEDRIEIPNFHYLFERRNKKEGIFFMATTYKISH